MNVTMISLDNRLAITPISRRQLAWGVTALMLLGFASLPLDLQISRYFFGEPLPGEFGRMLRRVEPFGHAYGVLVIAITLISLDPLGLRKTPRLLACSLGAGLLADLVKILILRMRPYAYFEADASGMTFEGSILLLNPSEILRAAETELHSCPSAHVATAVGLAAVLTFFYPHGYRWFLVLTVMVGVNRVHGCAHYLSDVFWGAAVGMIAAYGCFRIPRLAGWFDRIESLKQPSARPVIKRRAA